MKILSLDDLTDTQYRRLIHRGVDDDDATRAMVASICTGVRDGGDEALQRFTEAFDGVTVSCLRVDAREIATARASLDLDELNALRTAADHIAKFHAAQNVIEAPIETVDGVRCWRERRAIGAVGLYVPAGSAPLPSTVLMLGVPARIAGCARIALCSPPDASGHVNRYVLAAAAVVGIDEVYCVGGAQAIAGLAYGTESIERVDKIFGPGNRFVAAAKQFVVGAGVAIDLVAGPSELLVIADETANAALIAADLLSQAEHDRDACVVLVTTSRSLAESTVLEIERQFTRLDRAEITRVAIDNGCVLVVDSLATALRVANEYAPEHLQLNIRDPETAARDVA
ncbi:MAG: histidinol dehydrogenase, partial [bacterium]|nr:histidinol dehydrogenase [Candidatus Kapabacteria bacterium]